MFRIVYEIVHNELERAWIVRRAGVLFSVHESQPDAIAAAREHARSEHDHEGRVTGVTWRGRDGRVSGEERYGADAKSGRGK